MRIVLFGATGMIGQGTLKACMEDPTVEGVLSIARRPSNVRHAKVEEVVHSDFQDFSALESKLRDFDACLFCLGVSSAGMKEADYERTTFGITIAAAKSMGRARPGVRFLYVSGAGTDTREQGRSMWARVKGKTENVLLRDPALDAYMFRPGFIQPMDGIRSRTRLYRAVYAATRPLFPVLRGMFPRSVLTTRQLGRAMIKVAAQGAPKRILEAKDLVALAGRG